MQTLCHGSAVAFRVGDSPPEWAGLLIRGPSGAGKSDLALRCIKQGGCLVADDQVVVATTGAGLSCSAPETISGLLEVRGLGIIELSRPCPSAPLVGVVDLCEKAPSPRLPDFTQADQQCALIQVCLPRLDLNPFEASSPLKLDIFARLCVQFHKSSHDDQKNSITPLFVGDWAGQDPAY